MSTTTDTHTNDVIKTNKPDDQRFKYILEKLVRHLHQFARETRLTTEEWMVGIEFLTRVGQISSDIRQEFILLSDVLGLSVLVDEISHPKSEKATIGTLLGPFHTHDANTFDHGESFASDGKGEPCVIYGRVTNTKGEPLRGVEIDIWETDSTGHYDTQYSDRDGPDCRGIVVTDNDGRYHVRGIKPVSYPIPHDGPVGQFLKAVNRHPYRPAHIHFMVKKTGYDHLITALYMKGDEYEGQDAVFGDKKQLVVGLNKFNSPEEAAQYSAQPDDWYINFDIVLMTEEESRKEFDDKSKRDLDALGIRAKVIHGIPVADLD